MKPTLFQRMQGVYLDAAMISFNFMVLFVVVNLIIGFSYSFIDQSKRAAALVQTKAQGRPSATAQRDSWQLVHIDLEGYGDKPAAEIDRALDDTYQLVRKGFVYQPWVQFATPEFHSQSINVDVDPADPDHTFRRTASPREDTAPVTEVYLFGGSTAFGLNVADGWTIASYLQEELEKKQPGVHFRVRNYGRLLYYSSQEVELFERLLRAGRRPKIVIFLDGLNDCIFMAGCRDEPNLTLKLTDLLETQQIGRKGNGLQDYSWIPLVKLAYTLRTQVSHKENFDRPILPSVSDVAKSTEFVLNTYRQNVEKARSLAERYGVRCTFVWQPVPFYHYDLSLHRTPPYCPDNVRGVYQSAYDTMRSNKDVLFLGDACQEFGPKRKIFVDDVHYGPAFSQYLAQRIVDHLDNTRDNSPGLRN